MEKQVFQKVYQVVKKIPAGKVMTYGLVANELKIDARIVGWALHANKSNEVPCHRVVDRNGRLAPNFAFDGAKEQKRRLEVEGVVFKDEMYVDLEMSLWTEY
ncbi:MAG: MGMT family protein [bacterium]|nr:MGMT family protein [bacterium]